MTGAPASFAIKAAVDDLAAGTYAFAAQKTMYGGRHVAAGDLIFLFASENAGGPGLFARGIVADSLPLPRDPDLQRQTPRVSLRIGRIEPATTRLGRAELRGFRGRADDAPETELDFKLYRQATDKVVGLTPAATAFLDRLF
jgi:hypothetical protein